MMNVQTKIKPTTVDTKALRDALALVKPCMSKGTKRAIPVLGTVRVSIADGKGIITATDLDREIAVAFPAEGEPIDFLIQPRFLEHVLKYGGPTVEISRGEWKYIGTTLPALIFKSGELTAKFNEIIPVEDFPESMFDKYSFEKSQEIEASAFRYGLDACAASVSSEETRYYLNGVFLESVPADHKPAHVLRFVSTDGHRLTQATCPDIPWEREGMILPTVSVSQLRKDLKGLDKIKVAQSKDKLVLKVTNPNWSMVTKLIDGTFPDYRRVIPTDLDGSFSVALTGDALAALPRLSDRSTALHIVPEESRMFVRSPDLGEISMPIYNAKGMKLGVNVRYLKEFCPRGEAVRLVGRNPKADNAGTLHWDHVNDPVLVMGADENILRVVMPMRV